MLIEHPELLSLGRLQDRSILLVRGRLLFAQRCRATKRSEQCANLGGANLNQFNQSYILNPVEYPDRAGYNKFTRRPRSQGRAAPSVPRRPRRRHRTARRRRAAAASRKGQPGGMGAGSVSLDADQSLDYSTDFDPKSDVLITPGPGSRERRTVPTPVPPAIHQVRRLLPSVSTS